MTALGYLICGNAVGVFGDGVATVLGYIGMVSG